MDLIITLSQDDIPVTMLRDTGASQLFVLASVLPFSEESYCGSDVLIQGIELGVLKVPLHNVWVNNRACEIGCTSSAAR